MHLHLRPVLLTVAARSRKVGREINLCAMAFTLSFSSSLFCLLGILLLHGAAVTGGCFSTEREALLDFKAGVIDPRNRVSSWTGHHCCTWKGVACDTTTGHVVMLDLRNTNTYDWALRGERMNSSLLALSHLEHLDLSFNDFSGIRMPEFIGSFKKLRYLNLSSTKFMGGIPARLGNLSSLYVLDLRDALHFTSHVDNLEWLSHLTSLKHLDVSRLVLTNVPDWFSSVNMLPSLQVLTMSSVGLNTIPASVAHVNFTSSLAVLDLSYNNFDSTLPKWLWNISGLTHLDLSDALDFSSLVDNLDWLSHLTSLKHLDLIGLKLTDVPDWFSSVNMLPSLQVLNMTHGGLNSIPVSVVHVNFTSSLTVLDLSNNNFSSTLPKWLWNITSLTHLDLYYSGFRGVIPDAIGDLSSLTFLDLGGNQLEGSVPRSMADLRRLKELHMMGNQLAGNLSGWLEQMTNLIILDLRNKLFNGSMPSSSVGKFSNLTELYLGENSLGGVISEVQLENLTRLQVLDLYDNPITISIGQSWVPPFQLRYVYLTKCQLGPQFPEWLQFQTQIEELYLADCKIAGTMPAWFWNISSSTITYLDLSNNQIGGKLPSSFKFTKLERLHWESNRFEGPLPTMLPSTLDALFLSNNSFTGQLPIWPYVRFVSISDNMLDGGLSSSICQWTYLERLDLSNNKLLGEIPYCLGKSLQILNFLNLENNHFSGEIPHTIGFLSELQLLQLKNNSFSGEVPLSLKNCTNLWFLDLTQNNLVGSITLWMGDNLQQLQVLRLRSNMFSGVIPWQLARFEQLQILDLANNNFSGSIPHNIGNLSTMRSTSQYNGFCYDELDVFTKGQDLHYLRCSIRLMKSLDLSNNRLTGEILKGIGELTGLKNLNLSRNHLQSKIPREIGGMKSLESLDLLINDLSGSIPESLSTLYSLSYLNLSYNNFSGMIPSGNQLQTFIDPSIYMGNADLCGQSISKSCFNNKTTQNIIQEYKKEIPEWLWFYISMVLGYVMGFWIFCGILFLKDTWRHVYFHMIDDMYDRFWVQWHLIF
ncbi:receptor-like protein EIX2 [Musa acuminata AAA Group]|uniref:receptor-like protein EIX2 n=1 Tax=Musa acuminata AAA Group TaxID=214697 RepID=UPI0031E0E5CD